MKLASVQSICLIGVPINAHQVMHVQFIMQKEACLCSALFQEDLSGGAAQPRSVLAQLLHATHQRVIQPHHVLSLCRPALVQLRLGGHFVLLIFLNSWNDCVRDELDSMGLTCQWWRQFQDREGWKGVVKKLLRRT